jgi:hypothetical protein
MMGSRWGGFSRSRLSTNNQVRLYTTRVRRMDQQCQEDPSNGDYTVIVDGIAVDAHSTDACRWCTQIFFISVGNLFPV